MGGVTAIGAIRPYTQAPRLAGGVPLKAFVCVFLSGLLLALSLIVRAAPAFAGESSEGESGSRNEAPVATGQASSGELLFYPCTSCHPVERGAGGEPAGRLPNDFRGHRVALSAHDNLGEGNRTCLVCHDGPGRDPGKLKLGDGTFVSIAGKGVAKVCYRCHSDKYKEWEDGIHGKRRPSCTSAGCHDPHSPSWIYSEPLLPFTGTGFQVRAVSDRVPFTPLASAPVAPPVETPWWLAALTVLGFVAAAGLVGLLMTGRPE